MIETILSLVVNPSVGVFAGALGIFIGMLARFAGWKKTLQIVTDTRFLLAVGAVVWFLGTNSLRMERDRLLDEKEVIEVETGAIIDSADVVVARERRRDQEDVIGEDIRSAVDSAPDEEKIDVLLDEIARDQRRRYGDRPGGMRQ